VSQDSQPPAGSGSPDIVAEDSPLSADERCAVQAIDVEWLLVTIGDLIAERSHEGQETGAQDRSAGVMADIGMRVDRWWIDLDELRLHPAFSCEVERAEALGVVGVVGGCAPEDDAPGCGATMDDTHVGVARDLILNGHTDVVPPGDLAKWSSPPWTATVREGGVYGRGAVDMKGGLACALGAVRALQAAGIHLRGRLILESVVGEEDGGLGTLASLTRGYQADGAIVLEPTGLSLVLAQAGCLDFRITVHGKAGHGAMRWEGVSALEKFRPVHDALVALERRRTARLLSPELQPLFADYPIAFPISIGIVRTGDWASTVPEELVCEGRYGVMPGEEPGAARQSLQETVELAARDDDWLRDHVPVVEWSGGRYASAFVRRDAPIVSTLSEAHADLFSRPPSLRGVTYGADMGMLASVGGMDALLYGPGDVRCAHQPDEHVEIDALIQATRALVVTAMRFCGYSRRV